MFFMGIYELIGILCYGRLGVQGIWHRQQGGMG
jgi:hypothetical protein